MMRICEIFKSIQGEGLMMGIPTIFVRMVGCNLRCRWCDTQYSMGDGYEVTISDVINEIGAYRHVCITGGEPMLFKDMPDLLRTLISLEKHVVLETNGSLDLSNVPVDPNILISMDIKCPSSGMSDKMLISNLKFLSKKDQLKFIINDQNDFDFMISFLDHNKINTNIILSPVGGTNNLKWLAESVIS